MTIGDSLSAGKAVPLRDIMPGDAKEVVVYAWSPDSQGKTPPEQVHILLSFGELLEIAKPGRAGLTGKVGGAVLRLRYRADCDELIETIGKLRDRVFPTGAVTPPEPLR